MIGLPGRQAMMLRWAVASASSASPSMAVANPSTSLNPVSLIRTASRAFSINVASPNPTTSLIRPSRHHQLPSTFFTAPNSRSLALARPSHLALAQAARGYAAAAAAAKTTKTTEAIKAAKTKTNKTAAAAEKQAKAKAKSQLAQEKKRAAQELKKQKEAALKEKKRLREAAQKEKKKAQEALKKEKQKQKEKVRKDKLKAKEAAAKAKAKAKADKKKLLSWELLDAQGNKIPLPIESRPSRPTVMTLFVKERVNELRAKGEKVPSAGEIARALKALSPSELQQLRERTTEAYKQYLHDFKTWEESLSSQDHHRLQLHRRWAASQSKAPGGRRPVGVRFTGTKRARDPRKPVKPLPAFLRFCQEKRESLAKADDGTLPRAAFTNVTEWAQQYRALSAEEKAPYEEASARESVKWRSDMEKWRIEAGLQ